MLATRLCADSHDVVLIDGNQNALDQVDAQLDVLTIHGDVTDPRILEEAQIKDCDMVVGLTSSESVNIMACSLAHIAGVPRIIARVANTAYMDTSTDFDLRKLGIDLVINQQLECSKDLYNILRIPGAHEVVDLLDGRVLCVGVQLPTDSPLIISALKTFPQPEMLSTIRFVAYMHGDKLRIPSGDTHFSIGDIVYFIGEPSKVRPFLDFALPSESSYSRVVIAGGGALGMELAHQLEDTPLDVTLVEKDADRADYCSEILDHTLVIQGSSLDQDIMEELGINDRTAFVAVTGDDENNIMSCLVAEKMGAHFTTARVDNPNYQPIIRSLALLDRTVSPHSSLINAIYHFVRGTSVHGDRLLQKIPGEILEVLLKADHEWVGKPVPEIALPRGAILSTILRDDQLIVATGDVVLKPGDRVLLYGLPKSVKKLDSILK